MPRKQTFHAFTFVVEGSGRFPVDMLRYDRAVPHRQDDVHRAFTAHDSVHRTVELIAYTPAGNRLEPTTARWNSFGWAVRTDSIRPIPT